MEKDYTIGVPTKPPERMLEYVIEKGFLNKNYIIYRAEYVPDAEGKKSKMVHCHCTACGKSFYEEYASAGSCRSSWGAPFGFVNHLFKEAVISGNDTMCPECTAPVEVLHIERVYGWRQLAAAYPMSIHKIDGIIYLLSWRIVKWVNKEGETKIESTPYEGYAFEGRKAFKIVGYYQYFCSSRYHGEWESRAKCVDTYGVAELFYPFNAEILNGTVLENSKLDVFVRDVKKPAAVTYLRIFQKHKNVENLVMQGASHLLEEKIEETNHSHYCHKGYTGNIEGVDWKSKRPSEMLGLNKDEFKLCVRHKWTLRQLDLYSYAKENGIVLSEEDVMLISKYGLYDFKRMLEYNRPRNISVVRCFRYIDKQRAKRKCDFTLGELLDYWGMSKQLGDELLTDADIFPQSLKNAHDACTVRLEKIADEKREAEFKERYAALSAYNFELDGLCIRPPKTAEELRAEGRALSHCVYSYADRHASGKTAILFIRHVSEPEVPYFTLELNEKTLKVLQNRGKHNCARTEEVVIFEEKWLKHIQKKMKARVKV